MKLAEVFAGMAAHGVTLTLTAEGKLKPRARSAPPPELLAGIREHRAELMKSLTASTGGQLPVLPEPLARLVQAAVSPGLNYPANLPGGMVPRLGDYVLACAARYAAGVEPDRQIRDLWAARGAWAA